MTSIRVIISWCGILPLIWGGWRLDSDGGERDRCVTVAV